MALVKSSFRAGIQAWGVAGLIVFFGGPLTAEAHHGELTGHVIDETGPYTRWQPVRRVGLQLNIASRGLRDRVPRNRRDSA